MIELQSQLSLLAERNARERQTEVFHSSTRARRKSDLALIFTIIIIIVLLILATISVIVLPLAFARSSHFAMAKHIEESTASGRNHLLG